MPEIAIIMIEPENQGNIGAVARAMKNFGLKELYLIRPKDEIGEFARKIAANAQDILDNAKILTSFEEVKKRFNLIYGTTAISAKRSTNVLRITITPAQLANIISNAKGKVAVLLGRESHGLSNQELEECDAVVTIPSSQEYPTLNVAMAGTIIFYEIFQKIAYKKEGKFKMADKKTKELLIEKLKILVSRTNLPPHKIRLITRAFRNFIGKSVLSDKEARLLLTAFSRIDKAFLQKGENDGYKLTCKSKGNMG
ncbi:MAG: RNA methyltransferase [Nitrososphaeria archaeon]|nr:RNA methyltransferase [Nitrososphaeria archaeon]